MRRLSLDNYKKLVPLKRLAEASFYSFGYVSILVQRKKLKAKKIGNKYYSTQEWFDQYLELHARDEKRLDPAAVRGLSSNETAEQFASEAVASIRLKSRIDNLVERALKERLAAKGPEEKSVAQIKNKKEARKWIAGQARNDKTDAGRYITEKAAAEKFVSPLTSQPVAAEKDLAEVLSQEITPAEARLVADLVKPEKKLAADWSSWIKRGEKELKAAVREMVKNSEAGRETKVVVKNNGGGWVKKTKLFTSGVARKIASSLCQLTALLAMIVRGIIRKLFASRLVYFKKINCRLGNCKKVIKRRPLIFKTSAVGAIIYLVIFSFTSLAPLAAAGLSLKFERGLSQVAGQIKWLAARTAHFEYLVQLSRPFKKGRELAGRAEVVIPGKALSSKVKISLADKLVELTGRIEAVSLKLENNLKWRNQILARRLAAIKAQIFFITDFWSERLIAPASNIKLAARFLPARTVELGGETIMALRGFVNYQADSEKFSREKQGRVAGIAEVSMGASSMPRLLALANTTSRRGREVIGQAKYGAAAVLTDTADRQKELSLSLGRKLAKFTLAGARITGLASQSGRNKLARLENTISRTNDSIEQSGKSIQTYSNNGQKYLASEAGRSLWSLTNLYVKIIDRIIPESLKNRYARLYEQPRTIIEKEVVVKETTVVKEGAAGSDNQRLPRRLIVPRNDNIVAVPSRITNNNLSITGNANIGGELNVSGPVSLKNKLTVLGQAEFNADVTVAAALTAKSLLVADYAQFVGPINAKDLTADNLTSRNSLTVVGDSFVGGNELVKGNLKVAGALQAGHTEFSSLGVTGQLGAGSLSAGAGGLVVNGNTYLAGPVDLNEILDIDVKSGSALTVGDGLTDYFKVDTTSGGSVTIAATLNLSGNTQYSGDMDLGGALDLDIASTSALTVGDGSADNFIIDTVNDVLTLGYSSTTDQINVKAKQLAMNFASSTAGLLINYDGTGNIVQIVDNGVNRFILADSGNLSQTASTTGYAYILNQAGTNGSLLDVRDEGVSRFAIADFGAANLIASSTTGTALTVRQDSTGDILNLFDGNNEVLTILDGGNLGIGTTTPNWLLQAAGTRPFFALSDSSAGANLKHWTLSSQGGNLYFATSSDALATSTISALTVTSNGYFGIATTSPAVNFAVAGQCVTGDTRLRRRRKRRKADGGFEYKYDEVEIKDIMPGDEIASLDETTGKLVWSRVNALLDMGVKEIYKLTTASGKQIRTTSEHPYLVRQLPETKKTEQQKFFRFEVDQSGRMEELNRRTIVAAANQENSFTVVISAHEKRALYEIFRQAGAVRYYATFVFASLVTLAVRGLNHAGVKVRELVIDNEYIGHENRMKRIILASVPDIETNFTSIGRKSPAHYAAYYTYIKELKADALVAREEILNIIKNAPQRLTPGVITWIQLPQKGRSIISISGQKDLSRGDENKAWTKVFYLKVGQEIAVQSDDKTKAVWDKIVKIELLPAEQVYDIEVAGTHNFIGNDIVAHNTYITGGLGVGTTEATNGNITGTGRLSITSTSATSTFSTGGLTVGTNQFVVQGATGNVGIGTTSPGATLSVQGNLLVSGNISSISSLTATGTLTASNFVATGASATSTFAGGLAIETSGFVYDYSSGNVGIGTAGPSELLHIASAGSAGLLIEADTDNVTESDNPYIKLTQDGGANDARFGFEGTAGQRYTNSIANAVYMGSFTSNISVQLVQESVARLTIDQSGNVGIGTTTPNWLLQAAGTRPFFALSDTGAGTDLKHRFLSSQGGNLYIGKSSDSYATTTHLTIDTNGNVGIGTTSPYAALSVAGRGVFNQDIRFDYFTATSTTATSTIAGGLAIETSGFVYDYSTNNVGIGTAAPARRLHISDTSNDAQMRIGTGDRNTVIIEGHSISGIADMIGQVNGPDVYNWIGSAAAPNKLYVLNNGNVGIGTTSPAQKLHIENASGDTNLRITTFATGNNIQRTYLINNNGLDASFGLMSSGGSTWPANSTVIDFNGSGPLVFSEDAIEFIRIDNNGNVGIGTTTPATNLSVAGNLYLTGNINNVAGITATGTVALNAAARTSGSSPFFSIVGGADTGLTASTEAPDIQFNLARTKTHGTGALTLQRDFLLNAATHASAGYGSNIVDLATLGITGAPLLGTNATTTNAHTIYLGASALNASTTNSYGLTVNGNTGATNNYAAAFLGGNVGIGTASPGYTLDISGVQRISSAANPYLLIAKTNATARNWYIQAIDNYLNIALDGTSVGLNIDNNSNVGIGTSTPNWKLQAAGTRPFFALSDTGAGADLKHRFLSSQGGNLYIGKASDSYATTTHLTIDTNGNVGIGTAAPLAKLQTVDSVGLPLLVSRQDGNDGLYFDSGSTNSHYNWLVASQYNVGAALEITPSTATGGTTFSTPTAVFTQAGNVGIGTTTPFARLSVVKTSPSEDEQIFVISTSTTGSIFWVDEDGDVRYDGTASSPAADYAEYFYTQYTNLEPGETVCIDLLEKNAVKRCYRGHDNNVMGIVSTRPSILGNSTAAVKNDPAHYVIVGMLGQVDALVSAENGPIAVGDSLTSASSTPGYGMRADGGDSTVGVALEPLAEGKGKIKVLISRRNKSLAVEEVEQLVVERIANMKIEDQVQTMIKQAVDNLNLDPKIQTIAAEEAGKLDSALTARLDETSGIITNYELRITNLEKMTASSTALSDNIKIDESGRMVIGKTPLTPLDKGGEGEGVVQIIEPTDIMASSSQAAFVVNQRGQGDIADFQSGGVSVMNIDNQGQVKIVGSLLVDGRIMLCTGGYCSNALDAAVDETMADLGVEGKVVAGAFEGYCEDGYVWAPGSAKYGTLPGFCVMEDVAAGNGLNPPTPFVKGGRAWTNVSQGEAQYACQSLGVGYHLLSENEWLTLAENILAAGNELASSTALKLTNDNVINNLTGQIAEWTNQNVTAAGLPVTPARDQWFEYSEVVDFKGLNIAPDYYLTDANNHIGKIYVGSGAGLRGFVRGQGGIYGLDLSHSPAEQNEKIGFRCAK